MKNHVHVGCLALILGFGGTSADAQILAIQTANGQEASVSGPSDQTYGWRFTLESPVSVTDLGYFDSALNGEGFLYQNRVGIWDSGGSLLVDAILPAGTGATPLSSYRFVSVDPITLNAGETYFIGGHSPAANELILNPGSQTYGNEINYMSATYGTGSGFQYPNNSYNPGGDGIFGANFIYTPVPEPAEYAMLTGLGLAALCLARKRMAQRQAA